MTFDDDVVRVQFTGGTRDLNCQKNGIDWPPPETLTLQGFEFTRVSMSQISDEDRATMTNVFRGAVYIPKEK